MQRFAILTALGVFMFVAVGLSTITFAAPTLGNEFPILPKAKPFARYLGTSTRT